MVAALTQWDLSEIIVLLRRYSDLSQSALARLTGLSVGMVSLVENGRSQVRDIVKIRTALQGLRAPRMVPETPEMKARMPTAAPAGSTRQKTGGATPFSVDLSPRAVRSRLSSVMEIPAEEAVREFRIVDRQTSGQHVYAAAMEYLRRRVGPRLVSERGSAATFTTAAGMLEMAGWMAHDAGRDDVADQHFRRAQHFAEVGDDSSLTAQVWASRSHLALHHGQLRQAAVLAERGYEALGGADSAALRGRLLAMRARSYAAFGDKTACLRLLGQAERLLTGGIVSSVSRWTSPFDEGSLAGEAARCLYDLKDFAAARACAQRVLELRAPERVRSRSLASLTIAHSLIAAGNLDDAWAIMEELSDTVTTLGSDVVVREFAGVVHRLPKSQATGRLAATVSRLPTGYFGPGLMR
ncbi:helix-turn-helix domain-containing protein [Marinitenerispora sediminis]|uniref:HTH cro/C1-type domain-containing protein n=1 Tax=Marinitenerispora sediminis TaxID=1931232 RepID=A0A368TCS9_9ACTN|nr:helix-turn-helix domain-containing protein [Marinitenerispora sediminis]RCV58131.1 hypothetical protein DEF28_00185 [Marinitenerispora sediminis]RCV58753.1 hypothetical protein DEF23_08340 [Marinitenerispora sediminis]RCV61404.1 hypothetical protein DEF24_04455 [Marinitenerispora sediminis]